MSVVYLIPTFLAEGAVETIPAYVLSAILKCDCIFAENLRTARRFFKAIDKTINIDGFEWHSIEKAEENILAAFRNVLKSKKNIGIISEAGCPGVADPGQILVAEAQKNNYLVKPLVGPSSILLALMASGLNGQHFEFCGYLPIDKNARAKRLKELEMESGKNNSTKIFIETPYRNNQLIEAILQQCAPTTKLCIAANITADNEYISTKTIAEWKAGKPLLEKSPAIYLIHG